MNTSSIFEGQYLEQFFKQEDNGNDIIEIKKSKPDLFTLFLIFEWDSRTDTISKFKQSNLVQLLKLVKERGCIHLQYGGIKYVRITAEPLDSGALHVTGGLSMGIHYTVKDTYQRLSFVIYHKKLDIMLKQSAACSFTIDFDDIKATKVVLCFDTTDGAQINEIKVLGK